MKKLKPIRINFKTMEIYERRDKLRKEGISPFITSYDMVKNNAELKKAIIKDIRSFYVTENDI